MTMNTTTTDGGSNSDHPAANIDTIVVDPDDVVAAMRRNRRDETEKRSHYLRVSPPFEGEKKSKPHVSEAHTYYPPEMDPKPLHMGASCLLVGHDAGERHPDFHDEWRFPNYGTEKALFRDEIEARDDDGGYRQLTDDEEADWDDWWETVVEMWEDRVRHALKNTEELTLTSQYPDIEDTTVAVRLEPAE